MLIIVVANRFKTMVKFIIIRSTNCWARIPTRICEQRNVVSVIVGHRSTRGMCEYILIVVGLFVEKFVFAVVGYKKVCWSKCVE
jgi:hypothetical protein